MAGASGTDSAKAGARRRSERFDVVVVGARCAGSPLAALLARRGLRVALVEQARFPRDTLSTHVIEADGAAFLDRLGVIEELRETGAPFVDVADVRIAEHRWTTHWPRRPGDPAGIVCIRRLLLDEILARAAEEAGAEIRMGTRVTGLVEEGGRVAGVRAVLDGAELELRARLVVGADGRHSTVAPLAGSRRYNVMQNQRALYYTYFEGVDASRPVFVFHRWSDQAVLACPTDSDLYIVIIMPDLAALPGLRADLEAGFMKHALACEPVTGAIGAARRVERIFGTVRWDGYFREASGPGWVLVGDAGHFKDPTAGRGIGDAFCQVEMLAPAIAAGLEGSDADLDSALARWGDWRDRDFAEFYWFGTDLGMAGHLPAALPELIRSLRAQRKEHLMLELQNHRLRPSQVLTPPRLLGAVARASLRGPERGKPLLEFAQRGAEEMRRRFRDRRPLYEAAGPPPAQAPPEDEPRDAVAIEETA